jgi:uncharacterized membrane protein
MKSLINQMDSLPPKLRSKLLNTSNIISQGFGGVQTLIEHSPHLDLLTIDARRALIKHNIYITGALNALFLTRELEVHNNLNVVNNVIALYGHDVTVASTRNREACDPNGNLIKILIFILVFAGNCSIVTFDDQEDIRTMSSAIFCVKIQNLYVTAFWKYLVYLYGFDEAVVRFSSLAKRILNIQHIAEMISNNGTRNQMVGKVVAETERCLIIRN